MTATAATATQPATQAQRRMLGRMAGPTWERGQVELGAALAAAVTDPDLTNEGVAELLRASRDARKR